MIVLIMALDRILARKLYWIIPLVIFFILLLGRILPAISDDLHLIYISSIVINAVSVVLLVIFIGMVWSLVSAFIKTCKEAKENCR